MREDSALVDWEKQAGYSHLSLRGIRRTSDRKLMEAAAGKFCFVHHEHLEKRQESRRQSADDLFINIMLHVTGVMYIFGMSLSV